MTRTPGTHAILLIAVFVMLPVGSIQSVLAAEPTESVLKTLQPHSLEGDLEALAASTVAHSLGESDAASTITLFGHQTFSLLPRNPPPSDGGSGGGVAVLANAEAASGRGTARPSELGQDWVGLGRDTALLVGYETVLGIPLYRASEGADKGQPKAMAEAWWGNVRDPHWDADPWWVNYVGHPYVGAAYYVRARERGFNEFGSFLYAALLSTLFEYGVEAFFERPSYQDLIVTPVAGALIGAFIFEPLRNRIKAKPERAWHDQAIASSSHVIGMHSDRRVDLPRRARASRIDGAAREQTLQGAIARD
jgi:Domain of unknown function (DUF3943)